MRDLNAALNRLWDAYGKAYNERQIKVYYEWARTTDTAKLNQVIDIWIGTEKYFPSLSDLKAVYIKENRSTQSMDYEECYFCGSTGFVPSIMTKENRSYIVNYKCKCSNATTSGVALYFDAFSELEYKDYARDNKELNYPQVVDKYLIEMKKPQEDRVIDF